MSYLFDIGGFDEESPPEKKSRSTTRSRSNSKKPSKKQLRRNALDDAFDQAMQEAKERLKVGDWVESKMGVKYLLTSIEEKENGYLEIWGREYGRTTWLPLFASTLAVIPAPEDEIIETDKVELPLDETKAIEKTVENILETTNYHQQEFEASDDDSIALDMAMAFNRLEVTE